MLQWDPAEGRAGRSEEVRTDQDFSGDAFWLECEFTTNQLVSVPIYITLYNKPNKRRDFWPRAYCKDKGGNFSGEMTEFRAIFGLNKKLLVY